MPIKSAAALNKRSGAPALAQVVAGEYVEGS